MFSTQTIIAIMSGKRKGLFAASARFGLWLLTPAYWTVIGWRNRRYDQTVGSKLVQSVAVPVISIGNLTTGGTGKTPLVVWIAHFLISQNLNVVIVSRGYKSKRPAADIRERGASKTCSGRLESTNCKPASNDEAKELEFRLPGVVHLQNPDRVLMAQQAVSESAAETILLDDGFQHRKLHRELDIVLIDATEPFGYGYLLPRGMLREPIQSLSRADVVLLTRCNLVDPAKLTEITATIKQHNPLVPIGQTQTVPTGWLQHDTNRFALDHLANRSAFAFCGIGNPDGFLATLHRLDIQPRGSKLFPDHHHFADADLQSLAASARAVGASVLVCTHKDLVKIPHNEIDGLPVFALLTEVEFLTGQEEFESQLIEATEAGTSK